MDSMVAAKIETLGLVDGFDNQRLLEPIGYAPPAEVEELHHERQEDPGMVTGLKQQVLPRTPGGPLIKSTRGLSSWNPPTVADRTSCASLAASIEA